MSTERNAALFGFLLSFGLVAILVHATTDKFPNFDQFKDSSDDQTFEACQKIFCHQKPQCELQPSPLRDCATLVYKRSQLCPDKMKFLGEVYYQGYNEINVLYCNNDTFHKDMEPILTHSCWDDYIQCLAPQEGLMDYEHTPEQCEDVKRFLKNCEENLSEDCKEPTNTFFHKYYEPLSCTNAGSRSPTSSFMSWNFAIGIMMAAIAAASTI